METPWSATVAIVATAIAAIAEIETFLSRRSWRSQRSKFPKWPLFQRTCKLSDIDPSLLVFAAIIRLAIAATATIVAILLLTFSQYVEAIKP